MVGNIRKNQIRTAAALNENFTFLGFFVAWVVLEGSAKTVVGYVTLASVAIWFATIGIRKED